MALIIDNPTSNRKDVCHVRFDHLVKGECYSTCIACSLIILFRTYDPPKLKYTADSDRFYIVSFK